MSGLTDQAAAGPNDAVANAAEPHSVRILPMDKAVVLRNPGKDSTQILWPENAPESQVTITRVVMQPGAVSERHKHARSEQIWMVEKGTGTLLLGEGKTREIKTGDLVITPLGETHGVTNTGTEALVYVSVTTPPENFTGFYSDRAAPR
jgi:quercetin dioxygenase-like cupin family protein